MSLQCSRCLEANEQRRERVGRKERVPGPHENSCHFILGGDPREPLNLMSFLSCIGRGASERVRGKRSAEQTVSLCYYLIGSQSTSVPKPSELPVKNKLLFKNIHHSKWLVSLSSNNPIPRPFFPLKTLQMW